MEKPEEVTHTSPMSTRDHLPEHKLRQLALELEVFEDSEYTAGVGRRGNEELEDVAVELRLPCVNESA